MSEADKTLRVRIRMRRVLDYSTVVRMTAAEWARIEQAQEACDFETLIDEADARVSHHSYCDAEIDDLTFRLVPDTSTHTEKSEGA